MKALQNKRGIVDTFLIMVIIFVFALGIIIIYMAYSNLKPQLDAQLGFSTSTDILESTDTALLTFDNIFVIVVAMLSITFIISMAFIRSHPVFFFAHLLILVVIIFISPIIANTFETITANEQMNASATSFPTIVLIVGKMPMIVLVIGVLGMITLLAKPWNWGGGGGL